jgi:hypothetical protein
MWIDQFLIFSVKRWGTILLLHVAQSYEPEDDIKQTF